MKKSCTDIRNDGAKDWQKDLVQTFSSLRKIEENSLFTIQLVSAFNIWTIEHLEEWFPTKVPWRGSKGAAINCILMKFLPIFCPGVLPNTEQTH